jgi:hypothetical protein
MRQPNTYMVAYFGVKQKRSQANSETIRKVGSLFFY